MNRIPRIGFRIGFLSVCLSLLGSPATARAELLGPPMLGLEVGSSFSNMGNKITSSADASRSLLGTHQLIFGVSGYFLGLKPELGYTILARKGKGDSHTSRIITLQLPYVVAAAGPLHIKTGPSYWIHRVSGKGGSVELNNGTGTATFYRPSGTKSSSSLAWLIGAYFAIPGVIPVVPSGIDFDLHLLAPFSSRRTVNAMIQLSWGIL